jgi:hypothetical protein
VVNITGRTQFPTLRDPNPKPPAWRDEVRNRLRGASQQLIDAVLEVEAYDPGKGRDTIWAVSELDRVDKHRLVLNVAAAHTALELDFNAVLARQIATIVPGGDASLPVLQPLALRPAPLERLRPGLELLTVQDKDGFEPDAKFRFEILLGEPEPLKDEPVVPTLRRLADEVENLLRLLEPLA